MTKGREYLPALDMAKGLGILLVIFDHAARIGLCPVADLFEVPIFYVVAGFTFHLKGDWLSFLRQKGVRLLWPFAVFEIVVILELLALGERPASLGELRLWFFRPVDYPLWFIKTLFVALVLFRCVMLLRNVYARVACTAVALLVGVTFSAHGLPYQFLTTTAPQAIHAGPLLHQFLATTFPLAIQALPLMLAGFYVGLLYRGKGATFPKNAYSAAGVAGIAVSFLIIHFQTGLSKGFLGPYPWAFYPASLFVCLSGLALLGGTVWRPVTKALVFFGKNSMAYFCVHAPFLILFSHLLATEPEGWGYFLLILALSTASVLLWNRLQHLFRP